MVAAGEPPFPLRPSNTAQKTPPGEEDQQGWVGCSGEWYNRVMGVHLGGLECREKGLPPGERGALLGRRRNEGFDVRWI